MAKTKQVRWNGGPQDPDFIVQHGVTFNKGEWTTVPDDSDKDQDTSVKLNVLPGAIHGVTRPHKPLIDKLRYNPQFEVKGMEAKDNSSGNYDSGQAVTGIARAGVTTFSPVAVKNDKGKTTAWVIEGKNAISGANVPGPDDEYVDEASAQVVCDGLNQVSP